MKCIRLLIVGIAFAGVAGEALVAHAATTTASRPIYNYDRAVPSAQGALTSAPRASVLMSVRSATNATSRSRRPEVADFLAAEEGSGLIRLGADESWANPRTLEDHFTRHGADFGAKSAEQYAADASKFLQRAQAEGLPTKIASDGTIRVYDPATNTFGSYSPSGMTKTFFKPTSPGYWGHQPGTLVP